MGIEFDVGWTETARNGLRYWSKNDWRTADKIHDLIEEAIRCHKRGDNPLSVSGHPEFLKGNYNGAISRHINKKDRLIYKFEDNRLIVLACLGHYEDK